MDQLYLQITLFVLWKLQVSPMYLSIYVCMSVQTHVRTYVSIYLSILLYLSIFGSVHLFTNTKKQLKEVAMMFLSSRHGAPA